MELMYTGGVGRKSARAQSLRTEPLHTQIKNTATDRPTDGRTDRPTDTHISLQETFEMPVVENIKLFVDLFS